MNVKELFGITNLPPDVKMLYKGLIKRTFNLHNGWLAVLLKNNLALFFKDGLQKMSFGAVHTILKARDGKFMVIKENGHKAIWNAKGICLADFSKDTELFNNGWFRKKINGGLALFDDKGICIGQNLKSTEVFRNGFFFMAVQNAEDAQIAGVYNNKKERLIFTNSSQVRMLRNGWFITEGALYDNFGEEYINQSSSSKLSFLLLMGVASLMPLRKHQA